MNIVIYKKWIQHFIVLCYYYSDLYDDVSFFDEGTRWAAILRAIENWSQGYRQGKYNINGCQG